MQDKKVDIESEKVDIERLINGLSLFVSELRRGGLWLLFTFVARWMVVAIQTLVVWGILCFPAGKSSVELAPKNS